MNEQTFIFILAIKSVAFIVLAVLHFQLRVQIAGEKQFTHERITGLLKTCDLTQEYCKTSLQIHEKQLELLRHEVLIKTVQTSLYPAVKELSEPEKPEIDFNSYADVKREYDRLNGAAEINESEEPLDYQRRVAEALADFKVKV